MTNFNPDGSLKLPDFMLKQKQENNNRMKMQRCATIIREKVSDRPPKKCVLSIILSDAVTDNRFIDFCYKSFMENSEVPSKLIKINEKEFKVEIGTCFRRCTDCNSLIRKFRDALDNNVIEDKGSCTYELKTNFSYEDYFS